MSIVENRKAFHDYFIEERFEAGLALEGWEVKAIRAGRAQPQGSLRRRQERRDDADRRAHHAADHGVDARAAPTRRARASCCCTARRSTASSARSSARATRWRRSTCTTTTAASSSTIGLAKGKKQHDKRATIKEREWNREQQRLLRDRNRPRYARALARKPLHATAAVTGSGCARPGGSCGRVGDDRSRGRNAAAHRGFERRGKSASV